MTELECQLSSGPWPASTVPTANYDMGNVQESLLKSLNVQIPSGFPLNSLRIFGLAECGLNTCHKHYTCRIVDCCACPAFNRIKLIP